MTSLIAWIGVDGNGLASAYFGSDSRITWSKTDSWDYGRKLFACRKYPHILGYCGDVLFPTQTLGQLTDMIDSGLLVDESDPIDVCVKRIVSVISDALSTYPSVVRQRFEILYCMREGEHRPSRFHLRHITFSPGSTAQVSSINMPQHSKVISVLGSGRESFRATQRIWESSDVGRTSRAVFSAFCDSLRSGADPRSGGPPQLVGLWRRGGAKTFGILWEKRRYYYGLEVGALDTISDVRWYNERFEICDPVTLARTEGAMPQPRPKGL
jgi:hypothetical protein